MHLPKQAFALDDLRSSGKSGPGVKQMLKMQLPSSTVSTSCKQSAGLPTNLFQEMLADGLAQLPGKRVEQRGRFGANAQRA